MIQKTLVLVLICSCLCQAQSKAPFACNLKAFQPEERKQWRESLDQVMSSVLGARELTNGYALQIDTSRASLMKVAEWIALERKCCPFFDFQLDVHGEDGTSWLSLTGRDGVKDFIAMDFTSLHDKLAKARRPK
jgi:hypothetical protein